MRPFLLNMLPVLLLFGAALGFFLALVLAGIKRGNRIANRILAGILFLFSVDLVEGFMSVTYALTKIPCLIGLNWPLTFLYGPLVYFYVKALTGTGTYSRRSNLFLHFIPAVLLYLYLAPFYLAAPGVKTHAWFVQHGSLRNYFHFVDPILYVILFQIAGYLVLSLRLLAFHTRLIRQNFSSIETINLAWLRNLIVSCIGLLAVSIFFAVSSQYIGIYKEAEFLNHLIKVVLIYVLGYKGIQQPEIFTAEKYNPERDDTTQTDGQAKHPASFSEKGQSVEAGDHADKYRKSALTEEQAEKILARLVQIMETEKPYLETGLTLTMLSNMLDVSSHHLSQVINENVGKSFFDFVNGYRVEDAKRAITAPGADRFSILGIAMDAGFNSKSAFYTAFKKHTGMTPTRFKELAKRPDEAPLPDRR